jgi:hypothetical protein
LLSVLSERFQTLVASHPLRTRDSHDAHHQTATDARSSVITVERRGQLISRVDMFV